MKLILNNSINSKLQIYQFVIFLTFFVLHAQFVSSQNSLDQLNYQYKSKTNQLNYITDAVSSATSTVDLDNQSPNNYEYNNIGQLTQDVSEGILDIVWTADGKVKQVSIDDDNDLVADRTLQYKYDALGFRVKKIETTILGGAIVTTYYVRNPQGNLLSTYADDGSGPQRAEMITSFGTDKYQASLSSTGAYARNVGFKNYELKDQLGNIRVVVSDIKDPISGSNLFTPNVNYATDYYSFGALLTGRNNISEYKYAFQSKEKDDELKGNGNSYNFEARVLDSRVGRWLSEDPLAHDFYAESPYSSMGNNPIINFDPDGRKYTSERKEDESGNVTYTQTVTLAVLNRSGEFKKTDGYAEKLEKDLEKIYTGTETTDDGKTITWTMDAEVRLISSIDELDTENKEHLLILQDPSVGEQLGDDIAGRAMSDLVFMLYANSYFTRYTGTTGSGLEGHELGHTMGLAHNDIVNSWDPFLHLAQWMKYGSQGDTRNTVMDYNYVEKESIVAWQVELMYQNFANGKLNNSYSNWENDEKPKCISNNDITEIEKLSGK